MRKIISLICVLASFDVKAAELYYAMLCVNDLMNSSYDIEYTAIPVREICQEISKKPSPSYDILLNMSCVYFKLSFLLSELDKESNDLFDAQKLLENVDLTQDLKKQILEYDTGSEPLQDNIPIFLSLALLYERMGAQDKSITLLEKSKDFLASIEEFTQNQLKVFILEKKISIDAQIFAIMNPYEIVVVPPKWRKFVNWISRRL